MLPNFLSSPTYPLEKHYFLVPRFCAKIVGIYPETRSTWLLKMWFLINFFDALFCSQVPFYFGLIELRVDVAAALEILCPVATSIMTVLKMCCIWYYRNEFKVLIQRVRELLESQNSAEKMKIKRFYYTAATRLTFALYFLAACTSIFYDTLSAVKSFLQYYRGEPVIYEWPYNIVFPGFLSRMPWFIIALIMTHWYGVVIVNAFVAGDGLFCSFCLYMTVLLKLLAIDLRETLEDVSDSFGLRRTQEKEVHYKLSRIIERYNEIAEIMASFSDIMAFLTLAQFITSSVVIGISAINLLLFPNFYNMILYSGHTLCVTMEMFFLCIGGTFVMESSEDLATVAYCSPWYNHSIKIQKMVLTLMIRTQRSLIVKVPFFTPSLPVLTSILRAAGSMITLAKSLVQ